MMGRMGFSCLLALASATLGHAQAGYLLQNGAPTFTTAEPAELGFVNAGNGNLHLEIPLASAPQRGGLGFSAKLVYDSRIWQILNNGSSSVWQPTNVPNSWAGWRFITTADPGQVTYSTQFTTCSSSTFYQTYSSFVWTAPDGASHSFPITTQQVFGCASAANITSGDALAEDSTGYHMYVTGWRNATVYANDGAQVYPLVEDTNGNFFSGDTNGNVVDTLGRTLVTKTVSGSSTYYDVLNSQGSTSRFTVTTTTINVVTGFRQFGVGEYGGTLTAVQSLGLPDGTSYTFAYDSGISPISPPGFYGLLNSMTLPTGGQVTYAFTTFGPVALGLDQPFARPHGKLHV